MPDRMMIDFDDTLCDLCGAFIGTLNKRLGLCLTAADIADWGFFNHPDYAAICWGELFPSDKFLMTRCKPVANARVFAKLLIKEGIEPIVVTARPPAHERWVVNWLDTHMFPKMRVLAVGSYPKAEVALEYGMRVAIDDAPHNIEQLCAAGWIDHVYVPDRAYNRALDHPKIERFTAFADFLDVVPA